MHHFWSPPGQAGPSHMPSGEDSPSSPQSDPAPLLLLNLRISLLPLGEHQEPLTMARCTPRQWVSFPEGFYSIISLHNFLLV